VTTPAAEADGFGLVPAMGTGRGGAGATCPGRVRRAGAAGTAGVAGVFGLLPVRVVLRVLVCVLFTAIRARYPVRGG